MTKKSERYQPKCYSWKKFTSPNRCNKHSKRLGINSNKHILDGSDDCTGRDGAFDALLGGHVEIFDVSVAAIESRI